MNRVSCRAGATGFENYDPRRFAGCRVYVDGREIRGAIAFDLIAGTVEALVPREGGGWCIDPMTKDLKRRLLTGYVRVVLRDGKELA